MIVAGSEPVDSDRAEAAADEYIACLCKVWPPPPPSISARGTALWEHSTALKELLTWLCGKQQ